MLYGEVLHLLGRTPTRMDRKVSRTLEQTNAGHAEEAGRVETGGSTPHPWGFCRRTSSESTMGSGTCGNGQMIAFRMRYLLVLLSMALRS